jgi:hypothetical protein
LQRNHHLDYRPAKKNGYYWPFSSNVNEPDPLGQWLELPIHTEMVPPWKMATSKRMGMGNALGGSRASLHKKVNRALDFMRLGYPLKFDFCRMTLEELTSMMDRVILLDRYDPDTLKPIVAIGHSKDLNDLPTVDSFLSYLRAQDIPVVTFENIFANVSEVTHSH